LYVPIVCPVTFESFVPYFENNHLASEDDEKYNFRSPELFMWKNMET